MKPLYLLFILLPAMLQAQPRIIELRQDKVTQLIFPASITRTKGGFIPTTEILCTTQGRILDLQANSTFTETNINIVTADGSYYSYDLCYNPQAKITNHIIDTQEAIFHEKQTPQGLDRPQVQAGDTITGQQPPAIVSPYQRITSAEGYLTANNVAKLQKFAFIIKGVYADAKHLYLRLQIQNESNVRFEVDYIAFYITAKITKKTSTQERLQFIPQDIHNEIQEVPAKSSREVIYCFDRFTIGTDKILLAEVIEKNGDRNIGLQIKESTLINARKL